jgi:hypothetical protein
MENDKLEDGRTTKVFIVLLSLFSSVLLHSLAITKGKFSFSHFSIPQHAFVLLNFYYYSEFVFIAFPLL